jgi:trigger factor
VDDAGPRDPEVAAQRDAWAEDVASRLEAIAERRVKLGIVLSEIGTKNNIRVNDHELQRAVIQEAQKYPGQEAQVFEYYKSNRNALEALRAPVFEDKVVEFVLSLAKVTDKDVSLEDLTSEDEESYLETKKKSKGSSSSKSKAKETKASPARETKVKTEQNAKAPAKSSAKAPAKKSTAKK